MVTVSYVWSDLRRGLFNARNNPKKCSHHQNGGVLRVHRHKVTGTCKGWNWGSLAPGNTEGSVFLLR